MGGNQLIFALDPKLKLDPETLVLHSGPKFLCFVEHLYKYFCFWYQTEILSEKVYAVIWPVLEITSLEFCENRNNKKLSKREQTIEKQITLKLRLRF